MRKFTDPYVVDSVRQRVIAAGQGHLLRFWDRLDEASRRRLIEDLHAIDFDLIRRLTGKGADDESVAQSDRRIEPAPIISDPRLSGDETQVSSWRSLGEAHLRRGAVAALTVAGGQGTRLGFDGPKGLFPITPVRRASLFQWFAEGVLAAQRRYGWPIPWYIMTSPSNVDATRAYFEAHDYFGLKRTDVTFFVQGVMPVTTLDGRVVLEAPDRVAMAPDGHGGCLSALAAGGCIEDMIRRGIETVSYFQIDNPLVRPVDPVLIGGHLAHEAEVTSLTIPKADDFERVGNFVTMDGKIHVIEYTELPDEVARRRDVRGRRVFDAANLSIYLFSRRLLERLSSHGGMLPWHRAIKKAAFLDPDTGHRIEPAQPNALKFERFIFDALPLAEHVLLIQSSRETCFSPVKNASGVDSADQARRDLSRRAARWLIQCGVHVALDSTGQPPHPCEISPLVAEDVDELNDYLRTYGPIAADGPICLT